jgi:adhesin transport system membrane fusion protein
MTAFDDGHRARRDAEIAVVYPRHESWANLPLELRDEDTVRSARNVTIVIVAVLGALLAWAAVAQIDEAALASGRIVPAAAISDIHHLEGGIVDRVFVSEGDRVHQDQLLITLRSEQAGGEFAQIETRLASLQLKSARLAALLAGKEPDFGSPGRRFPKLMKEQKLAFQEDAAHAREERQQFQLAIDRVASQLETAKEELESMAAQVDIQVRLTNIREKSRELGHTTLPILLQTRTNLEEARQRLIAGRGRIVELTRMRDEAETKQRAAIAERLRKLAEELADTGSQFAETQAALVKHSDRLRRLELRAPADGVVYNLASDASGEVVKPGGLVAQIIPGEGFVAEVDMEPREIGHVQLGNEAEIRMSNYDPNVFGVVKGKVESISATTFETRDNRPFYRIRIALDRDHVSAGADKRRILPGMTFQAQIKTGSKSLLRYLLKPIYQSINTAFIER